MQATQIEMPAVNEFPRVRTSALPVPGPGQALVRVEATGVSFAEQQMRRGKYYDQPEFPFVPGYDLVGTVGGRRVAALTKVGGWADHVVLDEADLVDVPDGVSAEAAETVVVNGLTAYRMLFRVADVKRGGDDRRPRRQRRRRLGARAARAARRHPRDRHGRPGRAGASARAGRFRDRLPVRERARARA